MGAKFLKKFRRNNKSRNVDSSPEIETANEECSSETVIIKSEENAFSCSPSGKSNVNDLIGTEEKDNMNSPQRCKHIRDFFTKSPPAKESAYGGPPRFDWIDIETAAAMKLQSIYRRNRDIANLQKKGITCAAMRNRTRKLNARKSYMASEDIPGVFRMCGLGMMFGESLGEDQHVLNAHEKVAKHDAYYQKRIKTENERNHRVAKKDNVVEAIEVVEDVRF